MFKMVFINFMTIHPTFKSYFISPVDYLMSNLDYNVSTKILTTYIQSSFSYSDCNSDNTLQK